MPRTTTPAGWSRHASGKTTHVLIHRAASTIGNAHGPSTMRYASASPAGGYHGEYPFSRVRPSVALASRMYAAMNASGPSHRVVARPTPETLRPVVVLRHQRTEGPDVGKVHRRQRRGQHRVRLLART